MLTAEQIRKELVEAHATLEELKSEKPRRQRLVSAQLGWIDALQYVLDEDPPAPRTKTLRPARADWELDAATWSPDQLDPATRRGVAGSDSH